MDTEITKIDPAIPYESVIHYSKTKNTIGLIVNICLGLLGIILLTLGKVFVIPGIFFMLISPVFGYRFYQRRKNTLPQIIISDSGITTSSTQFKNWRDIKNEKIVREIERRNNDTYAYYYLVYDCSEGSEKIALSGLDQNVTTIKRLLAMYRARYEMKQNTSIS